MIRLRPFRFLQIISVQIWFCSFFLISSLLHAAPSFQLLHSDSNTLTVEFRLPKSDQQVSFSQLIGTPVGSNPKVTVTSLKLVGSSGTNATSSLTAVSVTPVGMIRDQHIAQIEVRPFHASQIYK